VHLHTFALEALVAAEDQMQCGRFRARDRRPFTQAGKVIGGQRLAGLDFHTDQPAALLQQQVDLVAHVIPPEIEVRAQALVVQHLTI
jgi:hypothetical protein